MGRPAVLEVDPAVWRAEAVAYIEKRIRTVGIITADDLRRDLPAPHHHNQYGAVFTIARSRNLIQKIASESSPVKSRHGGDRKLWGAHPDQLRGAAR